MKVIAAFAIALCAHAATNMRGTGGKKHKKIRINQQTVTAAENAPLTAQPPRPQPIYDPSPAIPSQEDF